MSPAPAPRPRPLSTATAIAALATAAAAVGCAGPTTTARPAEPLPPTGSVVESPRAFEESPSERASNTTLEGSPPTGAVPSAGEAISGQLPAVDVSQLRAASIHDCARGECAIAPDALGPALPADVATADGAAGPPPLVAWFQTIHPGATVRFPRRAGADLLGVVLAGRAALRLAESPRAAAQTAEPWTAFLLPEGGALVRAEGTEPVTLVLAGAAELHGAVGPVLARRAAATRARGGYVVRPMTELPDLAWARGAFHARIAFEAPGSPRASLEVLMGSARAGVAEHNHAGSWEVLVPLSAAGQLHIPAQPASAGADGGAPIAAADRAVAAGSVTYVPVGTRHEWVPDGTAPLIAVQFYAPPGPEQRFRALAAGGGASASSASATADGGAASANDAGADR